MIFTVNYLHVCFICVFVYFNLCLGKVSMGLCIEPKLALGFGHGMTPFELKRTASAILKIIMDNFKTAETLN